MYLDKGLRETGTDFFLKRNVFLESNLHDNYIIYADFVVPNVWTAGATRRIVCQSFGFGFSCPES
jgi:hypothetical protein